MSAPPDVLIVGGGVVGAACAYYLSLDGLRPQLLEAGFVGGGATAAAMGHIVVMDDSEPQLALTAYSRRLLDGLRPTLDARTEFDPAGTLWLAEDPAQLELVRSKHAFYTDHGIVTEILDEGDVARIEPRLRTPLAGALRVPGDHVVYPPGLAHWLAEQAVRQGATIHEHTRVDAIHAHGVTVAGRRIDAGAVVNAAGIAAPQLTPDLPVVPRKGHLVITERYPGFCRHELVELGYLQSAHGMSGESVAFNVQPRPTGQLLIGSSRELVGSDMRINRDILGRMLRRAVSFLPGLARLTAIRTWTGLRPATPDRMPFIGWWGADDGHWVAAGHEGLGITMALGTGRIISDLIAGRTPAIDATPFSPGRLGAGEA